MDLESNPKRLITFGSLHVDVLGPKEFNNKPEAIRSIARFLRAAEQEIRNLLREQSETSPDLKRVTIRIQ